MMPNEAEVVPSQPGDRSIENLSLVANELLQASAGKLQGGAGDPGLLITTEDVRRIARYVDAGLALPTDLAQIRQILGNHDSDIPGLQPEDIQRLYQDIEAHAKSWTPLEKDMRAVGSDLHVFAGNLITTLGNVIDFIHGLESWQSLALDQLTPEQVTQMPAVELSALDRKHLPGLLALVQEVKLHIGKHCSSTTRVKDGLEQFKMRLRDSITPELARKISLASSAETSDTAVRLKEDLAQLNERINQTVAEYDEYCKYRWIGAVWGPIGAAVTWSIFGPKAAGVRYEKDKLIAEKNRLETQLRQFDKFISDLYAFETSLQDLKIRIEGAASSVSNIESLWILLEELVDSSYQQIASMESVRLLVIFKSRFNIVISNWRDVKTQSLDLLTAFDRAVNDPNR